MMCHCFLTLIWSFYHCICCGLPCAGPRWRNRLKQRAWTRSLLRPSVDGVDTMAGLMAHVHHGSLIKSYKWDTYTLRVPMVQYALVYARYDKQLAYYQYMSYKFIKKKIILLHYFNLLHISDSHVYIYIYLYIYIYTYIYIYIQF